MAKRTHPRFVEVTVPDKYTSFCFGGKTYAPGTTLTVPIWMADCFGEASQPAAKADCFPVACANKCGGTQIQMYRDLYVLEPGVEVMAAVPNPEGCGRPGCVQFVACGAGCLFVDYDAPVALPEANITDGLAPDINPIKRDICTDSVDAIHMISDAPMYVQLIYTGCC